MIHHEDTQADQDIKTCINNGQNFAVVAGAGSGKTGSLIKALSYVRAKHGKSLRAASQKVVCITYTNAAVEIIKQRMNLDELFVVSTIHSFLWRLVESYQFDIRSMIKEKLIPMRIEKKQADDNGRQSKKAQKARKQVEILENNLSTIDFVDNFIYDDRGKRDYSTGYLNHDDIIDLVSIMILERVNLQRIIGQKYPYIFVDEAQDIFNNVMEALNQVVSSDGLPLIGYFGDPMQQIYENRVGQFYGPDSYKQIQKIENYRCSTEVIKLINAIRPDLQQEAGSKNLTGSVKIRLIQAEVGKGERKTYTEEQLSNALEQFDTALNYFKWRDSKDVKRLFLTRQMIAHRLGFSKLNKLFTGKYSSQSTEDDFKEGKHFALKPFLEVLIPVIEAHKINDYAAMIQILRQHSPLLDPNGDSKSLTIKEVTDKTLNIINSLVSLWETDTIKEILRMASQHALINLSERLKEHLKRKARTEEYDDVEYEHEKGDWLMDEFFTYNTNELAAYYKFIFELTPYSTQHGVKGDQFDKVLVIFDDTEASWNNYSFRRLLTPETEDKEPTKKQKQKSLNLAYVCFSRAKKDLRIILLTEKPDEAKQELIDNGWFREAQITIQRA